MKRLITFIMTLLAIVVMSSFVFTGNGRENRSLETLWRKYEKAQKEDRVQDMADLLEDLKAVSLKERKPLDYFRACDEYVNVSSRRNWKLTDSLISNAEEELRGYGLPVLEILFDLRHGRQDDSVRASITGNEAALKKAKTRELYGNVLPFNSFDEYFNVARFHTVENDYEYILWVARHYRGFGGGWPYGMLEEYYGDRYPVGPYVRFLSATSGFDRDKIESQLKKLAGEYAGRGIGMLAEDELFGMRFEAMSGQASSEDFIRLREEIRSFRRACSGLKGDDAVLAGLCRTASHALEQMEEKDVDIIVNDGKASVILKNTENITLKVLEGKNTVYETDVVNNVGSFCRPDTMGLVLPVLDDGEYVLAAYDGQKELKRRAYEKFTISVAQRHARDGMCIYAADYLTGEPVDKADLLLYDNGMDNVVSEYDGFIFNGFTELPEKIYPFGDNKGYRLVCRYEKDGVVRKSRPVYMNNRKLAEVSSEPVLRAQVVKDRAAFVPGDTVRFKVFMYEEYPDGLRRVVPEGEEVIVHIEDPEKKVADTIRLVTNEFGSASGRYAIDGKGRNGRWAIWVKNGRYYAAPSFFRVDEFVLPSYDLSFDSQDGLHFPGDEIKVTGKVSNYSGHGSDGLAAVAYVYVNHELYGEQAVSLAPDGSFEVSFVAGDAREDYVSCRVEIRLTDNTGETLEFNWDSFVQKSLSLKAGLLNSDSGRFGLVPARRNGFGSDMDHEGILSEGTARIKCWVSDRGREIPGVPVGYRLMYEGRALRSGNTRSGETLDLDMSGLSAGLYKLETKAVAMTSGGGKVDSDYTLYILYMPKDERVMPRNADRLFRTSYENGNITMQLGSGNGPVWAVVELFGRGYTPLKKMMVYLEGRAGEPGSLETIVLPHESIYSDKVGLNVLYFKDGGRIMYSETFSRPGQKDVIPLEFTSFVDKAFPGQTVSMRLKTVPGTEVLVSVFDDSSQKVAPNNWNNVKFYEPRYPVSASYSYSMGCDKTEIVVIAYGTRRKASGTGGNAMAMGSVAAYDSDSVAEEAVPFQMVDTKTPVTDVAVRDDFAATLAFEPFLRPAPDGSVGFEFRTSGKLSTFVVRAMAHDKNMNTAFAGGEMLVTLPVKVSVAEPQYLYAGDRYVLNASVSNTLTSDLEGEVFLEVYDGDEYLDVKPLKMDSEKISVAAGGSSAVRFEVDVPDNVDSLGFKVVFVGHETSDEAAVSDVLISDGVFVPVPVYPDEQILTEAHSAVLLDGESADELVEELRKKFVNVSSVGAEYSERTLEDLFKEAVPGAVEPESDNAISLSEALSVNVLAYGLHDGHWGLEEDGDEALECIGEIKDIARELVKCAGADGGFGWFEGMPSSPMVTAVVLEHCRYIHPESLAAIFDVMDVAGLEDEFDKTLEKAVKYLDSSYFGEKDRPYWCGRLSLEQYLSVRSKYADVPFDKEAAVRSVGKKEYKDFQKEVRAYLTPRASGRKTEGMILSKVRKIRILEVLPDALADAWGLKSKKKMEESGRIEKESLKQYAVRHPSGGIYYPNAVMPWRGLLEGEAYAHAMIGELAMWLAALENDPEWAEIARGISIWTMLQKETQEWSSDPGFVEALSLVNNNIGMIKNVKVIRLSKRFVKPFDEIKAAGNGFKVEAGYYKAGADGTRVRLSEGDSLHVGDKITAVYSLWSAENRSHVRLSVPRAACFRPAEQLSGWSGGWFRPLSYGFFTVSPYSYREVKAERTLYWIDVFPEEDTTVEEELFVTQEGLFNVPVAEIESLYAPHYRACDRSRGVLEISK